MAAATLVGTPMKRREDPRMITGRGTYTDDLKLPGLLALAFLRSPHGHARIRRVDVDKARRMPGVVAVYTGKDLADTLAPVPTAWLVADADMKVPEYRALAVDKVRSIGDAVAAVAAEDRYLAQDALEAIDVEYDTLPAVVDQEKATQSGAPQLYDKVPNNVAFTWRRSGGDVEAAFREADLTFRQRIINQRVIPNAMETRGAIADYNPGSGRLTLWVTSQNPHIDRLLLAGVLGVPESRLRVIAPDVGGGFGSKIPFYPGDMLTCAIAKDLGRPVKWVETRRENYVATTHGRDHITYVEVAAKKDGRVTGLRIKTYANLGAYLSTVEPGVASWLYGMMASGAYAIPNIAIEVVGVVTNTAPTEAYRGAGRPEAAYLIERVMALTAAKLGLDPVEVRRKNFIPKDRFPYTVATGLTYDTGDYEAALDKALGLADYPALRREQAELRTQGRLLGIGLSTYVESAGLAPSRWMGRMGLQAGLWESATVRVHPSGKIAVFTGTSPHGQGEETTFTQLVADEFGVAPDDIEVVHGDTEMIPFGLGTYGSRTTAVGGSAIVLAAREVREKAARIAAHLLEAKPQDVVFERGVFHVKGAPGRAKTFAEVAGAAYLAWNLPEGVAPGLEATHFFDPPNFVFPFGTHVCAVEVDSETGAVHFRKYVAVDDVGNVINPMLVDGQVHGGIVQGLAQAVYEYAAYDEGGQLLSGSMMDYAVPKAKQVPWFEVGRTVTPTPVNPLGIKGAGETGTIAATPAVVNAILDALRPYGIEHLDMPLTPPRIYQAMQTQKRS